MVNHFSRLGLATAYALSAAELDAVYLRLSSEAHPDAASNANSDADARLAALQRSAELNESYRVLKDPYQRAEHLLALLGGPSSELDKRTPPGFLEGVLELREELDEALAAGDLASAEAAVPRLTAERDRLLAAVGEEFARASAQNSASPNLVGVRLRLNATNYFRRMLQQIRDARLASR